MKKENKRKPGRPPLDPAGRQEVCRVRLTPTERAWLERVYGSTNAGLRALVRAWMVGDR